MQVEADSTVEPIIVMTRTFEAPRDIVWQAFTEPKHVAHWYGGDAFANEILEMDVRVGGLWRHIMRTPDGSVFEIDNVFLEVVPPERLVWRNSIPGKPLAKGLANVLQTVTFEEAGRRTRWKLVSRFDSIADRDRAASMGFARIIAQGSVKLEKLAIELAAAKDPS